MHRDNTATYTNKTSAVSSLIYYEGVAGSFFLSPRRKRSATADREKVNVSSLWPRYKVFPHRARLLYCFSFPLRHSSSLSPFTPPTSHQPPPATNRVYNIHTVVHNVQRAHSSPIATATTDSRNYQEISAREKKKTKRKSRKKTYRETKQRTHTATNATAWSRTTRAETESFSNLNLHTKRGRGSGKFNR